MVQHLMFIYFVFVYTLQKRCDLHNRAKFLKNIYCIHNFTKVQINSILASFAQ